MNIWADLGSPSNCIMLGVNMLKVWAEIVMCLCMDCCLRMEWCLEVNYAPSEVISLYEMGILC